MALTQGSGGHPSYFFSQGLGVGGFSWKKLLDSRGCILFFLQGLPSYRSMSSSYRLIFDFSHKRFDLFFWVDELQSGHLTRWNPEKNMMIIVIIVIIIIIIIIIIIKKVKSEDDDFSTHKSHVF